MLATQNLLFEMDLEICHVGSGLQTLIVTIVENCL